METNWILGLIIFIITYTGIIFTRLPWINIDRPSAAFFGAVAMILSGILSFDEAILSIDFNTIALLLGMMIIIATLQIDGFFGLIANKTLSISKTPTGLLISIVFITGIGSAFLVNDAVVLMLTPIIILLCRNYNLNPIPYLIAEILSSNVGSAMTITGNPQNMLIGMTSGISYGKFLLVLAPISIIGMILVIIIIKYLYSNDFKGKKLIANSENSLKYNIKSMHISVPIFFLVIISFFLGHFINLSISMISLTGASLILIFGKIKPSKLIREVDWVLLLFFACLFIVVHGIEKVGILESLKNYSTWSNKSESIFTIHGLSLVASQIVSNVPFVIAIIPLIKSTATELTWLSLASASTLAGNATIIGAVANLIVIESAEKHNISISFKTFFKSGIITTLVSFILSFLILYVWMKSGFIS